MSSSRLFYSHSTAHSVPSLRRAAPAATPYRSCSSLLGVSKNGLDKTYITPNFRRLLLYTAPSYVGRARPGPSLNMGCAQSGGVGSGKQVTDAQKKIVKDVAFFNMLSVAQVRDKPALSAVSYAHLLHQRRRVTQMPGRAWSRRVRSIAFVCSVAQTLRVALSLTSHIPHPSLSSLPHNFFAFSPSAASASAPLFPFACSLRRSTRSAETSPRNCTNLV